MKMFGPIDVRAAEDMQGDEELLQSFTTAEYQQFQKPTLGEVRK